MDIKNLLENCNDDAKQFMLLIINQLQDTYGEVPTEFYPNMILLRDWFNIYNIAKEDVYSNGVTSRDAQNRLAKNRNLSVMNIAFINLTKIMNQFSLSPLNKTRLQKLQSSTKEATISATEMLENLFK